LFFVTHSLLTPFANPSGEAIITATTSFLAYTIFLCLAALPPRSSNLFLPSGHAMGGCQTDQKKDNLSELTKATAYLRPTGSDKEVLST
jgi:hypothetical protein